MLSPEAPRRTARRAPPSRARAATRRRRRAMKIRARVDVGLRHLGVERIDADRLARGADGVEGAPHGAYDIRMRLLRRGRPSRRRGRSGPMKTPSMPSTAAISAAASTPAAVSIWTNSETWSSARGEVVVDAVPAAGARERRADAARAAGRVAHGGDGGCGIRRRRDHRNEEVLRAHVEHLLDRDDVADRDAHDRCDRIARHGVQLRERRTPGRWGRAPCR